MKTRLAGLKSGPEQIEGSRMIGDGGVWSFTNSRPGKEISASNSLGWGGKRGGEHLSDQERGGVTVLEKNEAQSVASRGAIHKIHNQNQKFLMKQTTRGRSTS